MTKLDIAKRATSMIVGIGVTKVVHAICQNNAQPITITEKVTVGAAGVVIGMIATDITRKYTDHKIDELAAWWNENIKNT